MRVAIIAEVFLPKVDGVVGRTVNLIRHLLECGDEVLVICPDAGPASTSPTQLCQFRSFPFPTYPEYRVGIPDRRLVERLDDFAPDVVHFINPFAFGFRCADLLAKSRRRWPTVFSFHTLYGEFVKQYPLLRPLSKTLWWLMRDYHNTADCNLTVSAVMRDELESFGFERVELWPPAVDGELFRPDRHDELMRLRLMGGESDDRLLLTVSRLAPEKNVAFLADMLSRVPNARLAIVGDGPQRAELEEVFQGTPTRFLGYLRGEELARAYASADAFVYASETETMGNVVLEAMAAGLPVVAPRAGGIRSLIDEGRTGLLYSPRDMEECGAAIRRALDDRIAGDALGRNARQAVAECGWRRSVAQVREAYSRTMESVARKGNHQVLRRKLAPAVVRMLVSTFHAVSVAQSVGLSRRARGAAPRLADPVPNRQ